MTVDAIFCGDLHFRETVPRGRTDDYINTQFEKLKWLSSLQAEYDCPVICAGDVLHTWKVAPALLTKLIQQLPDKFYTVYGNHDLPTHSMDRVAESGVKTLFVAGAAHIADEFNIRVRSSTYINMFMVNYGGTIPSPSKGNSPLLVLHEFIYQGNSPWPGCTARSDIELLTDLSMYRTILVGDNHKTFVRKTDDGRLLVNCGSFTRMNIDQKEHKPSVFLWDSYQNDVEQVFIPIKDDVFIPVTDTINGATPDTISDDISLFISSIQGNNAGVSFTDNLQQALDTPLAEEVKTIIYTWLDKVK